MTKAECVIEDFGFRRNQMGDKTAHKHDGREYLIRNFIATISGKFWEVYCDSYYGSSVFYCDGNLIGDFEYRYEKIGGMIEYWTAKS